MRVRQSHRKAFWFINLRCWNIIKVMSNTYEATGKFVNDDRVSKRLVGPGTVVLACHPSTLAGRGRRIPGTQEFEISLVNTGRHRLPKKEEVKKKKPAGTALAGVNYASLPLPFQPFPGRGPFHIKCRQNEGDRHPSLRFVSHFCGSWGRGWEYLNCRRCPVSRGSWNLLTGWLHAEGRYGDSFTFS